ncbi:MAG: phosphoglucomutase/phosphomannomutase family protein [Balneolaceae bacterium]
MTDIKFGTDGWRAVIAKDYTFENLGRVSQAAARWILDENITENGIVIGYDARFMGRLFARHSAAIFAAMGVPVRMADTIAPTPAVSWGAREYGAVGIVITASHNPPEYNGFKIKAPFGGPASPGQIARVEERYNQFNSTLKPSSYEQYLQTGVIREINLTEQYLDVIRDNLDLDVIRKSGIRIAHDPMYGSGTGLVKKLLGDQTIEIHSEINPSFNGTPPEPIIKNLKELARLVPEKGCAVGLANDGDADRLGMFDEKGTYVDSHQILSLLVKYLSQEKGMTGTIVKTFSTTTMLDKQAEKYGLPIETTPIGFKYVAELIVGKDVLVGGEESGGLAVKNHIPERDGIFIGLLITEMMVRAGKPLSELVQDLFDEFGVHATYRNDLHTEDRKKTAMMDYCRSKKLTEIGGRKIVEWQFTDGVKHILDNGSWLLIRPSGTEPVLRIYSEAGNKDEAVSIVTEATSLVDSPEILEQD